MQRGAKTLIPLAGVALVAFFVIGVVLSGSEPSATASPATVIAWYSSHSGQMKASGYLSSVGVLFGLVFFAHVRNYLSEAGGPRVLATAAFGGAVVFASGGLLGLGAGLALAADPGRLSDAAAQALNVSQNYIGGLAINFGAATLLLAAGAAAFIGHRFPAWIRWLSVVAGVLSLIPVPNVGTLTVSAWTLVVSITLLVRREEIVAVEREPALT
jgi:hypothetical protein